MVIPKVSGTFHRILVAFQGLQGGGLVETFNAFSRSFRDIPWAFQDITENFSSLQRISWVFQGVSGRGGAFRDVAGGFKVFQGI